MSFKKEAWRADLIGDLVTKIMWKVPNTWEWEHKEENFVYNLKLFEEFLVAFKKGNWEY